MKINDIPPEGLAVELSENLDLFDEGRPSAAVKASLSIRPEGTDAFRVAGTVKATVQLECNRCLKQFTFPVTETAVDVTLVPEGSLAAGTEHELDRGELDVEFYRGGEIEPADLVREQVLLALPMVPVHDPDCKGLCPVCGADRNDRECGCRQETLPEKDNPFAALKQIIKPEKE